MIASIVLYVIISICTIFIVWLPVLLIKGDK
jgi:hypothetical protein